MNNDQQAICEQFSAGNFSFCYPHFAAGIIWTIIGDKSIDGKEQVMAFCDKMTGEMSDSKLVNTRIIADNNDCAIEGYCNYTNADNKPASLHYCDVYHFENDRLASITSYCINEKK